MTGKQGRILTGHRPTGPRHIGHLVGTLENWVNGARDTWRGQTKCTIGCSRVRKQPDRLPRRL